MFIYEDANVLNAIKWNDQNVTAVLSLLDKQLQPQSLQEMPHALDVA